MSESVTPKCQEAGCPSAYGIQCAYLDQKSNHCQTFWCQEHVRVVEGTPYCRRHGPVVEALRNSHFAGHFPAIKNRAPSLTNWMGNALDPGVRAILGKVVDRSNGESLVSQELTHYFLLPKREHRWERAWKIVNARGVKLKVSVQIDELDDSLVKVEVDGQYLLKVVPPWVIRRKEMVSIDAGADVRDRQEFYQEILTSVALGVGVMP